MGSIALSFNKNQKQVRNQINNNQHQLCIGCLKVFP